jgi:hypothetical protein
MQDYYRANINNQVENAITTTEYQNMNKLVF